MKNGYFIAFPTGWVGLATAFTPLRVTVRMAHKQEAESLTKRYRKVICHSLCVGLSFYTDNALQKLK